MVECSFMNKLVVVSNPVAVTCKFLFGSALTQTDFLQTLLQISLLYRDLYKIYIGDDWCLFLVIFSDLSCFIHKNVAVEFNVHDDNYSVRQRCSKLYNYSKSSKIQ